MQNTDESIFVDITQSYFTVVNYKFEINKVWKSCMTRGKPSGKSAKVQ